MKIGMIAAMVIGMVVLNGCGNSKSFNKAKQIYYGKNIQPLVGDDHTIIVVDTNKVTIIHYFFNGELKDSTTYIVSSKCQ